MAFYDLVKVNTATTGTGTLTLGSAVSGFLSFSTAAVVDGSTVSYGILDGADSETGHGVYTASGPTLTRVVSTSTNANAAISLSGAAVVFLTLVGSDIGPGGTANALLQQDANGYAAGMKLLHTADVINPLGNVTGATTVNLALGNVVTATVTGPVTWTFSGAAASGLLDGFLLILTNGGSATQTWPTDKTPGGAGAPVLTVSGIDQLVFNTPDGGTTWFMNKVGIAYA